MNTPFPFYRGHEKEMRKQETQAAYQAKRGESKNERLLWARRAALLRGIRIYGPAPIEPCLRLSFHEIHQATRWDGTVTDEDSLSIGFRLMGMEDHPLARPKTPRVPYVATQAGGRAA